MSVLEMRSVSKIYGHGPAEVHALRDASLSVEAGSMVAVMGPSGSGKSTLLTIASSLEAPTSGEVLVGGPPLSKMSGNGRARLRRRLIGYVFQDFNLRQHSGNRLHRRARRPAATRGHRRLAAGRARTADHHPAAARITPRARPQHDQNRPRPRPSTAPTMGYPGAVNGNLRCSVNPVP
jgi:ABC-type glutathione transport system ATPase component